MADLHLRLRSALVLVKLKTSSRIGGHHSSDIVSVSGINPTVNGHCGITSYEHCTEFRLVKKVMVSELQSMLLQSVEVSQKCSVVYSACIALYAAKYLETLSYLMVCHQHQNDSCRCSPILSMSRIFLSVYSGLARYIMLQQLGDSQHYLSLLVVHCNELHMSH